jgi:hypothetical protein
MEAAKRDQQKTLEWCELHVSIAARCYTTESLAEYRRSDPVGFHEKDGMVWMAWTIHASLSAALSAKEGKENESIKKIQNVFTAEKITPAQYFKALRSPKSSFFSRIPVGCNYEEAVFPTIYLSSSESNDIVMTLTNGTRSLNETSFTRWFARDAKKTRSPCASLADALAACREIKSTTPAITEAWRLGVMEISAIEAVEVVAVVCRAKNVQIGPKRCFLIRAPQIGNCVATADVDSGEISLSVADHTALEKNGCIQRFVEASLPPSGGVRVHSNSINIIRGKKNYLAQQKRFTGLRELAPPVHSANMHAYFQLCARANYHSRTLRTDPGKRNAVLQNLFYIEQRVLQADQATRFFSLVTQGLNRTLPRCSCAQNPTTHFSHDEAVAILLESVRSVSRQKHRKRKL